MLRKGSNRWIFKFDAVISSWHGNFFWAFNYISHFLSVEGVFTSLHSQTQLLYIEQTVLTADCEMKPQKS